MTDADENAGRFFSALFRLMQLLGEVIFVNHFLNRRTGN